PDEIVLEGDVAGGGPRVVARFPPWGQDEEKAALAPRPVILEEIALDQGPLTVLELQVVLDQPRRPRIRGVARPPGERLLEMVLPDLDVGGNQLGDARLAAPEHDVLARCLQIV